jgi:predicted AAA+ superfamily ATPase
MKYKSRVVDAELADGLSSAGVVVIEGPKACGKTETARQVMGSEVSLDIDIKAQQVLAEDPSLVLIGKTPRLLDEWQVEPKLWNFVRHEVDARGLPGQFILTGSTVPIDDAQRHTGADRFSVLRMRPMSLFETGHSNGVMSLRELMVGNVGKAPDSGMSKEVIAERITIGGWPAVQDNSLQSATRAARDYLKQIREVDVLRVTQGARDPIKLDRFLKSYARNIATEVAITVLATDTRGSGITLSRTTIYEFIDALERLMIIEDQPAWGGHLRSKAILRKTPKRHFVDPSLAVAALTGSASRLLADSELMGFLFESLVIRDLRIFSQPLDGEVSHYRDNNGVEVDAIVQLGDGRWGAFEVKLGLGSIDEAAAKLIKFEKLIDTKQSGAPQILAVICGTGYAYRRADGVAVIPIGTLGP